VSAILPLRVPLTMITPNPGRLPAQLIDSTFDSLALLSCFRAAIPADAGSVASRSQAVFSTRCYPWRQGIELRGAGVSMCLALGT
jgi:hypothetical protein